jgi:hypothetical protein
MRRRGPREAEGAGRGCSEGRMVQRGRRGEGVGSTWAAPRYFPCDFPLLLHPVELDDEWLELPWEVVDEAP